MNLKEIFSPLILVLLALAFMIVGFLLLIFSKNKKLLGAKFKLGGIILTLTASAQGCGPYMMCYDPQIFDEITLNYSFYNGKNYEFDNNKDSILSGSIYGRTSSAYSFRLSDSVNIDVQSDDLIPTDGAFDTNQEEFHMILKDSLPEGSYQLYFYKVDKALQTTSQGALIRSFPIVFKR